MFSKFRLKTNLSIEDIDETNNNPLDKESSFADSDVIEKRTTANNSALGNIASKENIEKELVYYIRINDFSQLENATRAQKHLQWEVKVPKTEQNATEGKVRVRKVTHPTGDTIYYCTVKNVDTTSEMYEATTRTSKAFFIQFSALADYGMEKHRYTFPVRGTDLEWDIDVYPDGKGGWYSWARAELEFKDELKDVPSLPIEVEEIISPEDQQSEEGKSKVYSLFKEIFLKPNNLAVQLGQVPEDEPKEEGDLDEDMEEAAEEGKNLDEQQDNESEDSDDDEDDNEDKEEDESSDDEFEDSSTL